MARRAQLIQDSQGQAVRIPNELRFEDQQEVLIYRQGNRVILEPARARWSQRFLDLAGSAPDFPYPE